MNKVFLIGNLTRDPELTETPSGVSVCHFAIAVNRNYSSQDGENRYTYSCTAWRSTRKRLRVTPERHKVAVSGSIQLRNYEDNQGVKRTAVDIIVQDVEFLTPKSASGDSFDDAAPAPARSSAAPARKKPVLQPLDDDSDIPF